MLDLILDSDINPVLLSSFVGALSLFGKDNLGKIEEIEIKGLEIDMIIVYKYHLILTVILSKGFMKNGVRSEAEKALDIFYSSYVNEIKNIKECVDLSLFDDFKQLLYLQIEDYLEILSDQEKEQELGDFGFFTEAVRQLKSDSDSE